MSLPSLHISIAVGENSDMEAIALRSALEYFGARVTMHWIGRPNDFIAVLNGQDIPQKTDYLILSFHGDEGSFFLPLLSEDVYEKDEPKTILFNDEHIAQYAKFNQLRIIGAGCTLGIPSLANVFLQAGAKWYLAPNDYIDGNANYLFVARFMYEIINHNKADEEAYAIAKIMDDETALYQLYKNLKRHTGCTIKALMTFYSMRII